MRSSNEELASFNRFSSEQYAVLSGRLSEHATTLHSVRARLLDVFKRTRRLRAELIEEHPELQAAAKEADAAREAEIERKRT